MGQVNMSHTNILQKADFLINTMRLPPNVPSPPYQRIRIIKIYGCWHCQRNRFDLFPRPFRHPWPPKKRKKKKICAGPVKGIVSISSHAQLFYLAGEIHQLGMHERVIPVSALPAFTDGTAHMVPPEPTLWMRYGSVVTSDEFRRGRFRQQYP